MRKDAGTTDFYLTNPEIRIILGCEYTKASQVISKFNEELNNKGYMTMIGKIPITYFCERFHFNPDEIRKKLGKTLTAE